MEALSPQDTFMASDTTQPLLEEVPPQEGSTSTPSDPVLENVKNFKRKVISTQKFLQIFRTKEEETSNLVKQLAAAQQQIEALQTQNVELQRTNESANNATSLVEQAKSKQLAAEESLAMQSQKLKGLEMLKNQLEAKATGQDRLRDEMNELQKKLNNALKEIEHTNRKSKQEVSDLRQKLIKANADKANKTEWLSEQKRLWQKEEEQHNRTHTQGLQAKVEELEQQIEDMSTERYLEMEMADEEKKNIEESLQATKDKLALINEQNRSLNQVTRELRIKNSELEHKLKSHSADGMPTEELSMDIEEFEEVISSRNQGSLAKPKSLRPDFSSDQMDRALSTIEDLKTQFNILRLFPGHDDESQRAVVLAEQVKTLTKEKRALQDELTRQLTAKAPQNGPTQSRRTQKAVASQPMSPPSWDNNIELNDLSGDAATTSISAVSSTIVKTDGPKKRGPGRPRKVITNMSSSDPIAPASSGPTTVTLTDSPVKKGRQPSTPFTHIATDLSGSTLTINPPSVSKAAATHADTLQKRASKRRANVIESDDDIAEPANQGSPTKTRKPNAPLSSLLTRLKRKAKSSTAKKGASAPAVDLSRIEIRNISLNPVIPSVSNPFQYFTFLMNSPIAEDSQAPVKLESVAKILPEKLNDLFEAVKAEARDIVPKVSAFRQQHDILDDDTESWVLPGYMPIITSKSLCRAEVFMVQLLSLLNARFPEMNIFHRFFIKMYNNILDDAAGEGPLDVTSVLVRVLTGVCMAENSIDRARILVFDLLREIPRPKSTLVLCEAMASVWPAIFSASEDEATDSNIKDPRTYLMMAFQVVIANSQEAVKNEAIPFGYDTFVQRCGYPALSQAPYIDEVVAEMMALVREPDFMKVCQSTPGYRFTFAKALELLFVQGYEWVEFYNDYLRTELCTMMLDGERYALVTPLVAAVARETRHGSAEAAAARATPVRQVLEGVLIADDASIEHKAQAALAIALMSNGDQSRLERVKRWYSSVQECQAALPQYLVQILA
ncbi:hypothetical protein BGZ58_004957 [Dissophora ornata]|nr:hypothetical protein BGZ58_004957 [Dissophora ornata]